MDERRCEPRALVTRTVTVSVSQPEPAAPLQGTLYDLSTRGMRVLVPQPLPPGATVEVRTGAGQTPFRCEVVYCEAIPGKYAAGLKLAPAAGGPQTLAGLMEELFPYR